MTPASRRARAYRAGELEGAAPLGDEVARLAARVAALEDEKATLEQFVAVAAHELMVPLVVAESYATNVRDRLDGTHEESRGELDTLVRCAARTRLLMDSLLLEARASRQPLKRRRVDANRVVGDCVALLGPELSARGARIECGDLPEVLAEEQLLGSVFTNLIFNALKYNPRRGGTIRIEAVRELGQWRFLVTSDGPTIPYEDRERIFQPFHRARGERREQGAGLGLTICRRIIERHGGTIGVAPANGTGNSFFFTLPTR